MKTCLDFFFNIYFLPFLRVEKAIKKVAQLNARSCADEKNIKSLWKKSQRHISVFTTWRFLKKKFYHLSYDPLICPCIYLTDT